jgi:hypothetical protein
MWGKTVVGELIRQRSKRFMNARRGIFSRKAIDSDTPKVENAF